MFQQFNKERKQSLPNTNKVHECFTCHVQDKWSLGEFLDIHTQCSTLVNMSCYHWFFMAMFGNVVQYL